MMMSSASCSNSKGTVTNSVAIVGVGTMFSSSIVVVPLIWTAVIVLYELTHELCLK